MVLLEGVGGALIVKAVGGKLTTMLAGHLAAHSVVATNAAVHSSSILASSAVSAATMGGAAAALGHGAYAGGQLAVKIERERTKLRNNDMPIDPDNDEEVVGFVMLAAMRMVAQGHYQAFGHRDSAGNPKTEIDEIAPCSHLECECVDFDLLDDETCAGCGHDADSHIIMSADDENTALAALWQSLAQQFYPLMQHRDGNGNFKIELSEIQSCAAVGCTCGDFDLTDRPRFIWKRCGCGHKLREHEATGQWDWIIFGLAHSALEIWADED